MSKLQKVLPSDPKQLRMVTTAIRVSKNHKAKRSSCQYCGTTERFRLEGTSRRIQSRSAVRTPRSREEPQCRTPPVPSPSPEPQARTTASPRALCPQPAARRPQLAAGIAQRRGEPSPGGGRCGRAQQGPETHAKGPQTPGRTQQGRHPRRARR